MSRPYVSSAAIVLPHIEVGICLVFSNDLEHVASILDFSARELYLSVVCTVLHRHIRITSMHGQLNGCVSVCKGTVQICLQLSYLPSAAAACSSVPGQDS